MSSDSKTTQPVFHFEDGPFGCFYDIKTIEGRWVGCGSAPDKIRAVDAANEMWWDFIEGNNKE
jgi:hypothetical protein